jgi:hypothetical protein
MSSGIDFTYTISSENIVQTVENMSSVAAKEKRLEDFFLALSSQCFLDTGLLPLDGSGTLSIRQALGHMQVVFQHAPGIYRVIWGASEGDPDAGTYHLAMPYRIVIGDFVDGEFYGARHFYSTAPITSKDQILFHVNLPNLNCKGYGQSYGIGNGVGWICLYHNKPSIKDLSIGGKIANLIDRAGGGEAYNDNNMNETDGPRFYEEQYCIESLNDPSLNAEDYKFLWNPEEWENKSQNDFYWTLEPDIWLPIKVKGIDDQQAHHENGEFLTLGMAMDGEYRAYYGDPNIPKAYQKFIRADFDNPSSNQVKVAIAKSFNAATTVEITSQSPVANPILPIPDNGFTCVECKKTYDKNSYHSESSDGIVCEICLHDLYEQCASCDTHYHYSQLYYHKENFHCTNCVKLNECPKCSSLVTLINNVSENGCPNCEFGSLPKEADVVV